MEKKAKIIATLGPSIYKETELKKIIEIGVDAFRINFSHDTRNFRYSYDLTNNFNSFG